MYSHEVIVIHSSKTWLAFATRPAFPQSALESRPASPVDLVERPRVRETRVPYLVDDLDSLDVILATRPGEDRLHGPLAHAVLELLCKGEVAARERLARPPALTTKHACSDLFAPLATRILVRATTPPQDGNR